MTPIQISPSDFAELIFGSVTQRNAHVDEATYHWLRRPGKPAMDMPSKIVPPHIAAAITKADPDGAWIHIQTVTSGELTYHVMWEKRHWLESNERVMQSFHSAREHREAYFNAKSAELVKASAHAARLSHMISMIHACGVPKQKAAMFVEQAWRDAGGEAEFKARIEGVENLFSITGIYQEPYEQEQEQTTNDQATPNQDQQVVEGSRAGDNQDGQSVIPDRGSEDGAVGPVENH